MKTKGSFLIITLILFSFLLFSCGSDENTDSDPSNNIIDVTQRVTINFDSNGGTELQSINQEVDKEYSLPVPTKEGYTFDGWYYNDELIKVTGTWSKKTSVKLIAKWSAIRYTINYVTINVENNNPKTYTIEDEFNLIDLKLNSDNDIEYVFDGWYKDPAYSIPFNKIEKGTTGNIDVYAKWSIKNHSGEQIESKITFNAPGYDCDKVSQILLTGMNYSFPELKKDGYLFNGWTTEDGQIDISTNGTWNLSQKEVVLVPNWSKRNYSITYILNGGTNNEKNVETFTIEDNTTLFAPKLEYHTFAGWYTEENFVNAVTSIEVGTKQDIILYAKFVEIEITVKFDANEGTVSSESQAVSLGQYYKLLKPEREGFIFDGWYYGEQLIELSGKWLIEENIQLVAKWIEILEYNITYDLNGGKEDGGNFPTSYKILTQKIQIGIPSKEGYKFIGWSFDDSIEYYYKITDETRGNISLTANWYEIPIYSYQDNNGVQYKLKEDGTLSVVGYIGKVGNIYIPEAYEGYTVTEIGEFAFCGYGDKLANISSSSFFRCDIPLTITKISKGAFLACDDLKVQIHYNNSISAEDWVEGLTIEDRNNHVVDVILGKRPAIGWKKYWVPGK